MNGADALERIRRLSAAFVDDRGWQNYQSPKNLAMALIVEAAELVEHFQWMDARESLSPDPATRAAVETELADVLVYLVRLADVLDIDLADAAERKIEANARKYPVGAAPRRA